MPDLDPLFRRLLRLLASGRRPEVETLVEILALNMEQAKITRIARTDDYAIVDATRLEFPRFPDIGVFASPLYLMISSPNEVDRMPYDPSLMSTYNPKIIAAKRGPGFLSVARVENLTIGISVSGPDGFVESLFCDERPYDQA